MTKSMMAALTASVVLGASLFSAAAHAGGAVINIPAMPEKSKQDPFLGKFPWHQVTGMFKCNVFADGSGHFICDGDATPIMPKVMTVVGTFLDCNSATRYPRPALYSGWYCYDGNQPSQVGGKTLYPIYTSVPQQ